MLDTEGANLVTYRSENAPLPPYVDCGDAKDRTVYAVLEPVVDGYDFPSEVVIYFWQTGALLNTLKIVECDAIETLNTFRKHLEHEIRFSNVRMMSTWEDFEPEDQMVLHYHHVHRFQSIVADVISALVMCYEPLGGEFGLAH